MNKLSHIRLFVLDMDGTIYLGDELFPWTVPFLNAVKAAGAGHLFLTNNSSRTSEQYVAKLNRLGITCGPEHVLTSGDATIELLGREGRWQRLYLVATAPVQDQFREAGFELTPNDPQAVVLAYDTTLTYEKLRLMCGHLRRGVPFVATHPDINCPTPEGPIPDVGAYLALIEASTGRRPDRIVGKPMADILNSAMATRAAGPEQTMMIGDRLYTDIACGIAAGVTTGLVLSGESTRKMADESPHTPDYVINNLSELIPLLKRGNQQLTP